MVERQGERRKLRGRFRAGAAHAIASALVAVNSEERGPTGKRTGRIDQRSAEFFVIGSETHAPHGLVQLLGKLTASFLASLHKKRF